MMRFIIREDRLVAQEGEEFARHVRRTGDSSTSRARARARGDRIGGRRTRRLGGVDSSLMSSRIKPRVSNSPGSSSVTNASHFLRCTCARARPRKRVARARAARAQPHNVVVGHGDVAWNSAGVRGRREQGCTDRRCTLVPSRTRRGRARACVCAFHGLPHVAPRRRGAQVRPGARAIRIERISPPRLDQLRDCQRTTRAAGARPEVGRRRRCRCRCCRSRCASGAE